MNQTILRTKSPFVALIGFAALLLLSVECSGQPSTQATGSITGRIVNPAGESLPGANVYVASVADGRRSQSTKATDNGAFKIDGLTAGVYRVWASLPGYVPSTQSGFNSSNFYHVGDSVSLTLKRGGVITGKVTGPNGPLIAVGVFAIRVRDDEGKRLPAPVIFRERTTDDRGIYRIYGLSPGSYLVMSAKPRIGLIAPSAYDNDTPTYFPSSTRDTASEIIVREGEEMTADIQYRAEPGHVVSGQVLGIVEAQPQFSSNATVTLTDVRDRSAVFSIGTSSFDNFSFSAQGVSDGEYELSAFQFLQTRDELRSPPRRITVHGADVTGMTLTLAKQGAIEGRLVFEADGKAGCGKRRETVAQDTLVYARRYQPEKTKDTASELLPSEVSIAQANYVGLGVGNATGTFTLRNLPAGLYRIDPGAPAGGWYLRSIAISQPPNSSSRTAVFSAKDSVSVRAGETVSGITITFTEGAADLRGQIVVAEGQRLPDRAFVYLVPAEKDSANNLLRYFETRVVSDGTFAVGNMPPGDYLIVPFKADTERPPGIVIREDFNLRTIVVREAEKLKVTITLKSCERLENYELPYSSEIKP